MVKINKIYTKTGDDGSTGLADGSRVRKHDLRPVAYGTVDELNSILGLVVYFLNNKNKKRSPFNQIASILKKIQNDLFDLGADLSTPIKKNNLNDLRIVNEQIVNIEVLIDRYNDNLNPLKSFILPGGNKIAAWLHFARTVARRAERDVSILSDLSSSNFSC